MNDKNYCCFVFNATTLPTEDPKNQTITKAIRKTANKVSLRRGIMNYLDQIHCVQIMKSSSVFLAPVSKSEELQTLAKWITSADTNEAYLFDFAPFAMMRFSKTSYNMFDPLIEEAERLFEKSKRQKQNTKTNSQLESVLKKLEVFYRLLNFSQQQRLKSLHGSIVSKITSCTVEA